MSQHTKVDQRINAQYDMYTYVCIYISYLYSVCIFHVHRVTIQKRYKYIYIYMDSIHTVKLHFPDGGFFRPGLAIVFQIVGMEIMESLTGPGGLMNLTFPALQDVIDLEARVIDLCIPFGWHHLRESPGKVGNKNSMANYIYMGVSKNSGTPKSSILIGFSIVNHPFWGTPIFGNTHINTTHLVGSPSLSLEAERRTLQGINISHLGSPGEKENHLQHAILGGYVSSLEGSLRFTLGFVGLALASKWI